MSIAYKFQGLYQHIYAIKPHNFFPKAKSKLPKGLRQKEQRVDSISHRSSDIEERKILKWDVSEMLVRAKL